MVQNTSDIIYNIAQLIFFEINVRMYVCYADINYRISCKVVILFDCLANFSSIAKFKSLSILRISRGYCESIFGYP